MSIFSNIRKSRQQAKEHSAKVAEQKKLETAAAPYKHVPTHAATDAYASAPPSWREADRPRIAEQNRRRSAMAASGHHMNMPGIPRVGSSLSHVSYPNDDSSPMVRMRMPRAYSYSGAPTPYPDRNREVLYSVPDLLYSQEQEHEQQPATLKGKGPSRASVADTPRISPTSSKGEHSPARSSSGSTSSQDDLEFKASKRAHRLHPAHSRRTSDASVDGHAAAAQAKAAAPRDTRPPPSTRGFNAIPAPAMTPIVSQPRTLAVPATPDAHGSTLTSSRPSSTTSLPALTPTSTRPTPAAAVTPAFEFPMFTTSLPNEADAPFPSDPLPPGFVPAPAKYKDRRTSRTTRFTELERIESHVEPMDHPRSEPAPVAVPEPVPRMQFINAFPEPAGPLSEVSPSKSKSKSKKLTKGGGKLVKKTRTAVAV